MAGPALFRIEAGEVRAEMTDNPLPRRLAAIVVADIVGYSRLTTIDEEGTVLRFGKLMDSVIKPAIDENQGRFVKHTGDGFIAEFSSAAAAFRGSMQIQMAFAEVNHDATESGSADEPLLLRMGIDIGDIIITEDDVFGNGVNIAARLETLAEAGGICVSQRARDHLAQFKVNFVDLGEQHLKNIAEPVRVFQVTKEAVSFRYLWRRKRIYKRVAIWSAAAAVMLTVLICVYLFYPRGVSNTEQFFERRVAELQCSWLTLAEFSEGEGGAEVSISGASVTPGSSVEAALRRDATEADVAVSQINVRQIVPMEASQCQLIEALRRHRHTGISRLEADEVGIGQGTGARFTVVFDPDTLGQYANIYSIDPDGSIILVESRDAMMSRAVVRPDGREAVDYMSGHIGWGGILLMEADAPIDNDLVLSLADRTGQMGDIEEIAERNDWRFELVWLNSRGDSESYRPQSSRAEEEKPS